MGKKFIQGQSLHGDKVYAEQSLYDDKDYKKTLFSFKLPECCTAVVRDNSIADLL